MSQIRTPCPFSFPNFPGVHGKQYALPSSGCSYPVSPVVVVGVVAVSVRCESTNRKESVRTNSHSCLHLPAPILFEKASNSTYTQIYISRWILQSPQNVSSATPTFAELFPMLHLVQSSTELAATVEDHVPLSQFLHWESFALPSSVEYLPAAQGLQTSTVRTASLAKPSISL